MPESPGIWLHAETVGALQRAGGTWAVYQNQALDSAAKGSVVCLRYGPGCTFEVPPDCMPDTAEHGPGWKYRRVALVDPTKLPTVYGDVEITILPLHAPDPAGGKHV